MTDEPPAPPRRRRPRYRGTHPRRFEEKYKELDAARYPDERAKVLAAGKTPAGSHVAVLVREVLAALDPRPGDLAVDATLGHGGHAAEILERILPGGRLLGLDVDPVELPKAAARLAQRAAELGTRDAFQGVRRNFAGLRALLAEQGWERGADVILADLGVSSMQLDDPSRGFSWKHDVPLDLRMNPEHGLPAGELVARLRSEEIEDFLRRYGDEPHAREIAAALHRAAATHPLLSTSDVARAVESAYENTTAREAREQKDSSLARTFQALRILVNDELTALDSFLRDLPACLAPGGRVAILTFHSGEDRRVKIRATPGERRANPRSSPAKLRWAARAG